MHFVDAKGILSGKNGMNIYRGCTHGCIYCDSRSKCYGFTHEFEDIEVKINAPQLLEKALKSKRKKCMIGTGAMCDPYLHIEENLKLTRKCLELIDQYEYGVAAQTKSTRVLRDYPGNHPLYNIQYSISGVDQGLRHPYRREAQCTGDYRISGNCGLLSSDLFCTDTYLFHDYSYITADGVDVGIRIYFSKVHSESGHDYILLPDLCTGHVILYLPDQTASLWNISGVDDLYQFLDL